MLTAKLRVTPKKVAYFRPENSEKNREFFFHCMAGMP
jgi:hypothetical protein